MATMSYTNPGWANGVAPALNKTNLDLISDALHGIGTGGTLSVRDSDAVGGFAAAQADTASTAVVRDANKRISVDGVIFDGATGGGVTSKTLDDYEEGAFTPKVIGTSTAGTGTYSQQQGYYTKVGRIVHITMYINMSNHTGTGNIQVTDLPFVCRTATNYNAGFYCYITNLALTASNYFIAPTISSGGSVINLFQGPTGGGAAAAIPIDTSFGLVLSGSYEV